MLEFSGLYLPDSDWAAMFDGLHDHEHMEADVNEDLAVNRGVGTNGNLRDLGQTSPKQVSLTINLADLVEFKLQLMWLTH